MAHLQQIHGQIVRCLDEAVAGPLAEEAAAFGEEVEGTLRHVHLEARHLFGQLHNKVAATLEGLTHLLYRFLCTRIGCLGRFLRHGARAGGVLSLQLVDGLYNPFGAGNETDAPARHGIRLGHAVDDDRAFLHLGELRDALVLADVVDVLVDFIGHHHDLRMVGQHSHQSGQLFAAVDRAGRVGGRAEYQHAGLGRDGSFQLGRSNLEVLLDAGRYDDGAPLSQLHHFRIAHPEGSRYDDLIARIDQGEDGVAYRLLGTVGTRYLCSGILQAVLVLQLGHDGVAQRRIAGYRRIAREVVVDGLLGCLLDVVGGVKVGFADTQVDYVYTLCLQLSAFL